MSENVFYSDKEKVRLITLIEPIGPCMKMQSECARVFLGGSATWNMLYSARNVTKMSQHVRTCRCTEVFELVRKGPKCDENKHASLSHHFGCSCGQ